MTGVPSDAASTRAQRPGEGRLLARRYRLLERIDEGGAGEVWLARDERLGRDVAIKILGPKADDAFRERFADEARRAAAVAHPNVVTIFDEGRDGTDTFMVMEHVRGHTLRDVVADRGPLRPHEAARLVAQIAAALDAAHEAGVIHCDVKPANVIVDNLGVAKLTDFGIARAARGPREHELIGTARYIAPERIEGKAPTERSDVYSLGLVAYELIAGRPPFADMETEDLLRSRLDGGIPSLRSARVGISEDIELVVAKALARDPRERYASAGAFARDLLAAAQRDDATGVLAPVPRTLRRGAQRGVPIDTTIALVAIIAVLVATLAIFAAFQGRTPQAAPSSASPGATAVIGGAPNVVGRRLSDAIETLQKAGFGGVAWDVQAQQGAPPCTVVRQQPAAGATFRRGDRAEVWYAPGNNCTKKD
ncbi:MAG TPA: protein kinase [Candidatus Limnocylindria bacterium]|jgi:serine/threonine-protein kinase|nr:protein kinase [Candidatus Limnocylindria bacterium]